MKKRIFRIIAVVVLGGLAALGAGNIPVVGQDAVDSFQFGAIMVGLIVASALLAIYALKGEVSNLDFDNTMVTAVQQIQNKQGEEAEKTAE